MAPDWCWKRSNRNAAPLGNAAVSHFDLARIRYELSLYAFVQFGTLDCRAGHLPKGSLGRELVERIRPNHAGRAQLPTDIVQEIALDAAKDALTDRDIAGLKGLASRKANKGIARQVAVTEAAIKAQLKRIFSRLHVVDRTLSATVAKRRGYLS